ncbi:hypothetical protein EXT60_17465 [Pectobacterium carotovorum subsp. carotovorum]|nr:hypothetical protein [Pectobacterium carotovorum]MCL6366027.1 hypothetical protein [Pectobacterium carotovorum subsp. carotovorum]
MQSEILKYNYYVQKRMGFYNFIEIALFFLLVGIFSNFSYFMVLYRMLILGGGVSGLEFNYAMTSLVLTIFPIIYTLSYGCSPLQKILLIIFKAIPSRKDFFIPEKDEVSLSSNDIAMQYFEELSISSANLASSILSRSSLYLLVGVLSSVGGLLFFYYQVANIRVEGDLFSTASTFFMMVPKISILIFIELIAFFFLRQYKSTMDEFRYYESIKRSRQETLAILKLISINNEKIDYLSVMDKIGFRSKIDKLEQGQTLDILESKKLEKHEFEILSKIIDSVVAKK